MREIATLTLFMTMLALVYAVVMLCNFNKGLKEASKLSFFFSFDHKMFLLTLFFY